MQKLSYFSGTFINLNSVTRLYFRSLAYPDFSFWCRTKKWDYECAGLGRLLDLFFCCKRITFLWMASLHEEKVKGRYSFINSEIVSLYIFFSLPFDLLKGALPFSLSQSYTEGRQNKVCV